MKQKEQINLKQSKGTWRRYIKLLIKARLPLLTIAVFILSEFLLVNVGVSETEYTAKLFAGDVSAELVTRLLIVVLINMGASSLSALIRQVTTARIDRNTRKAVWNQVLHLPMSFFKEDNPQETINRIVGNASRVSSTITTVLVPILTSGYGILVSVSKVSRYDIRLALTLLLSIPLAAVIAFITGRLKYSASRASANVGALLTERLSELITNIPLAKAFAREGYEEKRGAEITKEMYQISVKTGWINQLSDLAFSILSVLQTVAVVLVGWILVNNEAISRQAWTTFFLFSGIVMNNVNSIVIYWHNTKNIQGTIDRVAEIMDAPLEGGGTLSAETMTGDIEVKGLCFGYQKELPVLRNVSCTFQTGKVTALLGVSGCGKSTFVNLIDRIYTADAGEICVDGHEINDYELESYRSRFAVISQNPMLFSGSIRQNLLFGMDEAVSPDGIWNVLEQAHLADFVRSLPKGLETEIGERGNRLSGGQKQKLALARMLLQDAPYVILDEATASMDTIAVQELKQTLADILKGRTVILIAHSPQLMSLAQNVVVMDQGRISVCGEFNTCMEKSDFLTHFMKGGQEHE